MLFSTDKQTLDDLNIFGKHGGTSVYEIYNRTLTRGGAAELEQMFRHPLAVAADINRRSSIIQYFAGTGLQFPFDAADLEVTTTYLGNRDVRTQLDPEDTSVARKLGHLLARDGDTDQVYRGVKAFVSILKNAHRFRQQLNLPAGHAYESDAAVIAEILAAPEWQPVLAHTSTNISHEQAAGWDVLFRFRHSRELQLLLGCIYRLDVYISVATVARERGYAFPAGLPPERPGLVIRGLYHPAVKNAVANDVRISPEGNVVFLTGANMAGKSTFMKSLSIALLLAHAGMPVAASQMEFAVLDGMYTTINLPDNLGMGASHFYAEVMRVKKMAQELAAGKRLFVLFDELFRGTNVKDAYEATIAIAEGFARKHGSLFVISTHIVEAGPILKERCSNVHFVYLPTYMDGNRPVYPYKLENGITNDRHGMIIINNEGILDILRSGLEKMQNKGS